MKFKHEKNNFLILTQINFMCTYLPQLAELLCLSQKAFKVNKRKLFMLSQTKKEKKRDSYINIRFEMYGMQLFKRKHETQSFHLAI